jgi:hypothetical protein
LTVKYPLYYYWYKMYCTMLPELASSPRLSPEAAAAHGRLLQQALVLAGLSEDFQSPVQAVSATYARALGAGDLGSWAGFVAAAVELVRRTRGVAETRTLDLQANAALAFFTQIVDENDDLLALEAVALA